MRRFLTIILIIIIPTILFSQEELLEKPDGYFSTTTLKIAYFFGTLDLIEKDFPIPNDVKEYKDIVYTTIDSTELKLDIYHSKNITDSAPLLIFIHGGGWKKGDKHDYLRYLVDFARKGYITATVQYRFVDKVKYPAQILDIKAAIKWLKNNNEEYFIDLEHVAVIGGSAGGHLALMAGYTSDVSEFNEEDDPLDLYKVQAVVDLYGPADLTTEYAREHSTIKGFIGKSYAEVPDLYSEASPITYITNDDPPTLIFQGTLDDLVPFSQSDSLKSKLDKVGVPAEYHKLEGWPHTMDLGLEVNEYCQFYMNRFFEKYIPFKK
ncbi:MAG: alpha/beta hydrolase [Ignavibacteriae bacterium]|nr:alpha/beta hydrolase [Ignavibacteriota bacterium]